jgi:acyl carrier protein
MPHFLTARKSKVTVRTAAGSEADMRHDAPTPTEPDIETWCTAYLRKALKLSDVAIDVDAEFASIGLDSAESVFLIAAIEDWLGLELASDTAMEHPTIARLSRFVASQLKTGPHAKRIAR